jgi:hypothetical protein
MFRLLIRPVAAVILLSISAPVWAAEPTGPLAPSAAVAAAWAKEKPQAPSSAALKALYGSYGGLQTLDMATTIQARNAGAREMNPAMAGGYGQAAAVKVLFAAGTVAAVAALDRKHHKAALVTMAVLNVATASIVVNNYRNAQKLNQR